MKKWVLVLFCLSASLVWAQESVEVFGHRITYQAPAKERWVFKEKVFYDGYNHGMVVYEQAVGQGQEAKASIYLMYAKLKRDNWKLEKYAKVRARKSAYDLERKLSADDIVYKYQNAVGYEGRTVADANDDAKGILSFMLLKDVGVHVFCLASTEVFETFKKEFLDFSASVCIE